MVYQVQQVDDGYQIFRLTTVQEYPPEIVSAPLEGEKIYAFREEALQRLEELNRSVKQQLGRVVEITVQCDGVEREQGIRAVCAQLVAPLQDMLEFLTFTDVMAVAAPGEQQRGVVRFLMRLLDSLTHADADGPLRDLLNQFLEFAGVTKVSFSFWIVEVAE
jgi:hypothetical protein